MITSQRSRRAQKVKYEGARPETVRLPEGEVIKEIQIVAKGHLNFSNFAGGSPKTHKDGILQGLIRRMQVITDGNEVNKSFRGVDVLRRLAKWTHGTGLASRYKTNSQVLGKTSDSVKGFAPVGNDGEDVAFVESIVIPFDNKLSSEYARTRLNLKGKSDAYLQLDFEEIKKVLAPDSDDCDVTGDIEFSISYVTSPHLREAQFLTWKQVYNEIELTGQANQKPIDLNLGGLLQGFWLTVEKGAGRERLTMEECENVTFQVIKNGEQILKDHSLLEIMQLNVNKSMIAEEIDSSVYVNFLDNRTFSSGLQTGAGSDIQSLELRITTPAGLGYSPDPVRVLVEPDIIVKLS